MLFQRVIHPLCIVTVPVPSSTGYLVWLSHLLFLLIFFPPPLSSLLFFSPTALRAVFQTPGCWQWGYPGPWAAAHTSVCTLSFSCPSAGTLGCANVQRGRTSASSFCLLGSFSHNKWKCLAGTAAWVKDKVEVEQLRRSFWLLQEKSLLLSAGK